MRESKDNDQTIPSGERVTVTTGPPTTRPIGAIHHEHERDHDVKIPEALNLDRDRVRWGPIVAGLLTAITTMLLLSLLGAALGLAGLDAGRAAAQGAPAADAGRNAGIWGAISGILSFLLGGYVAGRASAVFSRGWGAMNGALVFMLGVPITLLLATMGLGAILGTLGNFASAMNVDPSTTANAAQGATDQAREAARNLSPEDARRAAETARNAATGAFGGSLLALGASALGGFLGTRREVEVDARTGHPRGA